MRRAMLTTLFDIRFQVRHGFYAVYALICAVYFFLLYYSPSKYKETITLLLTFSDPGAVGLIVAGGIVLLERDQGIHASLFVTPIRLWEYLLAKALSLSLLSLTAAWVIHVSALGLPAHPLLFSLGVILTSSMFTLLSIVAVVRTKTINGFILLSQLYALPFTLPLLGLFNIGADSLYAVFPTSGSLLLLRSAYSDLTAGEVGYAVMILLLGNAALFLWARQTFEQRILRREGGG